MADQSPTQPTSSVADGAPKFMDLREFRDEGYLQEVNRQFFHPLGLALSVKLLETGAVELYGIWDYRDDPEGFVFGDLDRRDRDRGKKLEQEQERRLKIRHERLGFGIQPITETNP